MGPRGFGGLCLALLSFGVGEWGRGVWGVGLEINRNGQIPFPALGFQEEEENRNVTEEWDGNVTREGTPEPPGHPSTAPGDRDTVTTWSRATTSPPGGGDIAGTPSGNQTRTSSGVPARYWSPVIFVLLALLVLFVTYHRKKDRGIRDRVPNGSDSSDLGALVQSHDLNPQEDPGTPPDPELSETPLGPPGNRNAVTEPTEPTKPTEPTDPINPTEPTEPRDPTEPTEPTEPTT
ncbi:levansucrase-like [Catharus ustulatus]|uniref:levansucrase-like n=1 Tax=Catharus ustulatus TaxID=91951 RepID=UPI001409135C|nr:levansucrase-like [Catharus ustulatus]